MDIPLLVAKLLGVYLVVSGLFLMFRGKTLPRILKDFFGHPAIVYFTGVILISLSALILLQSNIWDGTWRTVVTIFAWLILLKGLLYIFAPELLQKMANKKLLKTVNIYGIIAVIIGLSLFFIG